MIVRLRWTEVHVIDKLATEGGHILICLMLLVMGAVMFKLQIPYGHELMISAGSILERSMGGTIISNLNGKRQPDNPPTAEPKP